MAPVDAVSRRVRIVVRGGRGIEVPARGQDIGVYALIDGRQAVLPVAGLVLRVDGRKAIATVNLIVDEVDITGVERVDDINIEPRPVLPAARSKDDDDT